MFGNDLQKKVDELIQEVPRTLLEGLIERKLEEIGEEADPETIASLCDKILSGEDRKETANQPSDGNDDAKIIAINQADIDDISNRASKFAAQLPELMDEQSDRAGRSLYRELKKRWPDQDSHIQARQSVHAEYTAAYWGDALAHLEMLVCIGEEMICEAQENAQRSRAKRNLEKCEVQHKLAVRATNVTQEVIALIWAGFPDGANARWRTLHEIAVVANLIEDADNELARRYLAHDIVESKRALDAYIRSYEKMGYKPPSKREQKNVSQAFDTVIAEFGNDFASPYGWACEHLGKKKPIFPDLERAVEQDFRLPFYKQASANVHAGARGISQTLGLYGGDGRLVMGSSIIGFEEPGIDTSIAYGQILLTLLPKPPTLDALVIMKTILELNKNCQQEFERSAKKVRRDFR
ncbi:hypothetical protein GCM10011367_24220 [Marinicauda pacifica]|uniref:Uncharacterized protein n=1 Tax=Marinicauda pacifica TaxID=1133559 RepID=A0A4V3RZ06_9PROT|nr:DUF5677 domain-containing protein [Marinicauda pacifica]TGY92399.1 hypothetical protein E5162_12190 [Marinicauda pacifica]GGE48524.1 hypothetical protein GCM10011367_24220 [Marinicauda pacifica]